jgi:hypothetical protein
VLYVNANGHTHVSPYTSWSTAATNIQDAVDAANPGDQILVTNGIYQEATRVVYGILNRVAVTKAVTVQSVNGPAVTIIQGKTYFDNIRVRCVYLTNGAALMGFTLTNGTTEPFGGDPIKEQSGGAVWCESTNAIISNCVIISNTAYYGGGVYSGTLSNCLFINNNSSDGGGAYSNVLNNCTLVGNSAVQQGGGASGCILNNCTISSNSASPGGGGGTYMCTLSNCTLVGNAAPNYGGGGAFSGTLNDCILSGNSASQGGAAFNAGVSPAILNNCIISNNFAYTGGGTYGNCILNNCTLVANLATNNGGGVFFGTLNNCVLAGNWAGQSGGGAAGAAPGTCMLNNCTLIANFAGSLGGGAGGGAYQCTVNNCILYYNSAPFGTNSANNVLNNCCTTQFYSGTGNITNEPNFVNLAAGDFHLQSNSPCINAGINSFIALGTDLDGNPRIKGGTVDIGAYEFQNPSSIISYAWLQRYGLPTDGSTDYTDSDSDGMNNWQEWRTGTNPTNALSVLKMASATPTNNSPGIIVSWQSISGVTYFLQRRTSLAAQPAFSTIQSNIVGQASTTSYTDITATNGGPYFYRVGVQ